MNIKKITTHLPAVERYGVTPTESPTVPKALTDSNKRVRKGRGCCSSQELFDSVIVKRKVAIIMQLTETRTITMTFLTVSEERLRFHICTDFCCLSKLPRDATTTAKLVVLIPPAVEPGDPPIHIKNIIKNKPAIENWSRGAVENPAVRAVTL